MNKFNLRVTVLEKFRRYINEISEYETEESLMESLSGEFKGNEYTRIGTAFHKIVECGDISKKVNVNIDPVCSNVGANDSDFHETYDCLVKIDDFNIVLSPFHVSEALKYKSEIKGCFHEVRMYKDYTVNGVTFNISGCTDVLLGRQLRDIKTKYSYIKSIEDYTDSVQSKLYMDIFEIPEFYFDVFEFVGYKKEKHGYDVSSLQIKRHDPIHCIAYEGMRKDIDILLSQFWDYVKFRKLEHLFLNPTV